MQMHFSRLNNIVGWGVFCVALTVYVLTVEPTASYWDCSEYIATSAKLQVGHPPGAPFFQMMGAVFANFASTPQDIALSINMMSVFSSAFTILFLFWTLTRLAQKVMPKDEDLSPFHTPIILGVGLIGALSFCFTDSFWFNAVEAEVYAMATCIMAVLFWLGLRWEEDMNTPRGDRWLVLIAFVIGLSFGVHFMGLLTIPAIGMMYFFKNYPNVTIKNFLIANAVSVAILLFIFKLLLPSTLAYFGNAEVFFVNEIGMPFNSGTIIAGASILLFFVFGLRYTHQKQWVNVNTGLLCVLFILIGFSSWVMLPIRSNANTVINENAPGDARALLAYYNLEQYPDTYLFYGPMFSDMYAGQDPHTPYKDDKPKYERDYKKNKYIIVNDWKDSRINSNSAHEGLLPRMWSSGNAVNYMRYFGAVDFDIKPEYSSEQGLIQLVNEFIARINDGEVDAQDYHRFLQKYGSYLDIEKPSLLANLRYLFEFQIGYMYWRYFMWNFSGRQNDNQGKYTKVDGNWISGIPFIDNWRLGSQKNLPEEQLNNKARNTYYMLPLFFGILGLLFLYHQDKKRFWITLVLFLFTGLALKIYLNERVFEPRERDYALVGSFYAFSIYIGFGVLALIELLKKYVSSKIAVPLVVLVSLIAVPMLMASENWDDHDRSDRYTAQSTAKAYLDSVEEGVDAMIFTIGDNDTFALWYAQEIEEYRTDVRSINTQLLATDWYIDQMKRKTYESTPIPSQLEHHQYAYGVRDYIKFEPIIDSIRWDIEDFMNWVGSDNPRTKYKHLLQQYGAELNSIPKSTQNLVYYPTNKIRVPVNKDNVLKSGIVKSDEAELIVDYIDIELPTSGLYKNRLMMLDILKNNDWKRPIYFTGGSFDDEEYFWMKEYLQLEGLVYKLVPIKTPANPLNPYQMGRIDALKMYSIVKKWDWGNSESPFIYHDPETRKNSISFRGNLSRLADALIEIGEIEKATEILDLGIEKMPIDYFGYYSLVTPFIKSYYNTGEAEKAWKIASDLSIKYIDRLEYYTGLSLSDQIPITEEILTDIERFRSVVDEVAIAQDPNSGEMIENFRYYSEAFKKFYGEYDYYTSMSLYLTTLLRQGLPLQAMDLYLSIAQSYQNRIELFQEVPNDELSYYAESIQLEIEGYRAELAVLKRYAPEEAFTVEAEAAFENSIKRYVNLDEIAQ